MTLVLVTLLYICNTLIFLHHDKLNLDQGHLCLRKENLNFINNYII